MDSSKGTNLGRDSWRGRRREEALRISLMSGEYWESIFQITIALIWFWTQVDLDISIHVNRKYEIFMFNKWGYVVKMTEIPGASEGLMNHFPILEALENQLRHLHRMLQS